jgi:hypothetical protein
MKSLTHDEAENLALVAVDYFDRPIRTQYQPGKVFKIATAWEMPHTPLIMCEWDEVETTAEARVAPKFEDYRRHCTAHARTHIPVVVFVEEDTRRHCFYFCLPREKEG